MSVYWLRYHRTFRFALDIPISSYICSITFDSTTRRNHSDLRLSFVTALHFSGRPMSDQDGQREPFRYSNEEPYGHAYAGELPCEIDPAHEPQLFEPKRRPGVRCSTILDLLRIYEGVAIATAGLISFELYIVMGVGVLRGQEVSGVEKYLAVSLVAMALAGAVFHGSGVYRAELLWQPSAAMRRLLVRLLLVFLFLATVAFLSKSSHLFSRGWGITWLILCVLLLALGRYGAFYLARRLNKSGYLDQAVAIVGDRAFGADLWLRLTSDTKNGIDVVCTCLGVNQHQGSKDVWDFQKKLHDFREFARNNPLDQVIIASDWSNTRGIQRIVDALSELALDIRLAPTGSILDIAGHSFGVVGGIPMLNLGKKPLDDWWRFGKSVGDRFIASFLLATSTPTIVLIAILIKLQSPGPILFRQARYGFHKKLFRVYKFRTMYVENQDLAAERLVTRDDSRVTPLGRLLRRYSLDELPQLYNVIRGDMSLVGPRPHAPAAKAGDRLYQDVVSDYAKRHKMKPGITGLAQVRGWRGETDNEDKILGRVKCDLEYIDNWSIWLDLKILVRTIIVVVRGTNAH